MIHVQRLNLETQPTEQDDPNNTQPLVGPDELLERWLNENSNFRFISVQQISATPLGKGRGRTEYLVTYNDKRW